jgi:hypothetical protein
MTPFRSPLVQRLVAPAIAAAAFVAAASPAAAQSCVLTRLDSPVLHAFDPAFDGGARRWEASFGWRYGKSDRHFVGTEEQHERRAEGSEVINTVHLADLQVQYSFDARNSISVAVPFIMADRTGPVRSGGVMVGREMRSETDGIGDLSITYHRLLRDPAHGPTSNLSLGLGVDLPTGDDDQRGTRTRFVNGVPTTVIEVADQSVQPGDGGYGVILQSSGYTLLGGAGSTTAFYGSATYIVTPEEDSGVPTFRGTAGEEVMSISDQYVARFGLAMGPRSWKGWSAALGARLEGIPVHDLVGGSDGFRRPGYMLSVEPSVSWTRGASSVSLSVPVAVERNRQASVPDIRRGAHGDAAFPDYLVIAGYSRRF